MWPWFLNRTKRRLEAERVEAERERAHAQARCARVRSIDPAVRRVVTDLVVHREFLPEAKPKD